MKIKKNSIRINFIFFLSVMMTITLSAVGLMVFSTWKASSDEMIRTYEHDAHADIRAQMEAYLNVPLQINQMSHYSIENEIVDLRNEREREIYFAGIIKSAGADIYSFSYGTAEGEHYGARRNPDQEIEIMKTNPETMGRATYYATNPDLTSGKMMEQLGEYDPRTRDWYVVAKEKNQSTFSPTYTHFIMNDLAITAAFPVHDAQGRQKGVLATTYILSGISEFLNKAVAPKNASAFIFERNTGEVIASTENMPRFISFPDKPRERIRIDQLESDLFSKAYREYLETARKDFIVDVEEESHGVNILEYQKNGLDWIIITTLPRSQFLSSIMEGFWSSLTLFLLALGGSLAFFLKSFKAFLKPIDHLVETTGRFSEGDFTQRVKIFHGDEIGQLSHSLNQMADRIQQTLKGSEEEWRTKTLELEKRIEELTGAAVQVRRTLDSVDKALISTDMFGDVTMMNAEAESLTGWSREEAVGAPFDEVFHVVDGLTNEGSYRMVAQVFEGGEKIEFDGDPVLVSKAGTKTPIEGMVSPIEDEKGTRLGVVIRFKEATSKRFKRLDRSS